MKNLIYYMPAVCILISTYVSSGADIRSAQAEFDRCESTMERVRRSFTRYEETIRRLKDRIEKLSTKAGVGFSQEITKMETEIDYIRGSIDRASGQAVKIRSDIANLKGPTCPSCLSSSINMYCRNSERLLSEIEEHQAEAANLEERLRSPGASKTVGGSSSLTENAWNEHRQAIDSLLAPHQQILDSCTKEAGQSLWKQCKTNLHAADSLHAAGTAQRRDQALKMVEILLPKAIKACRGE